MQVCIWCVSGGVCRYVYIVYIFDSMDLFSIKVSGGARYRSFLLGHRPHHQHLPVAELPGGREKLHAFEESSHV